MPTNRTLVRIEVFFDPAKLGQKIDFKSPLRGQKFTFSTDWNEPGKIPGSFLDQSLRSVPPSIVAYLAGGESALRTEIKSVQRNCLRCLADSADYGLLVFKLSVMMSLYHTIHDLYNTISTRSVIAKSYIRCEREAL